MADCHLTEQALEQQQRALNEILESCINLTTEIKAREKQVSHFEAETQKFQLKEAAIITQTTTWEAERQR